MRAMLEMVSPRRWHLILLFIAVLFLGADGPDAVARRNADKQALAELQAFVGSWRGAGQPRRGSTDGAWVEKGDWAWKFTADSAALHWTSRDAKYAGTATLRPGSRAGEFQLSVQPTAEGEPLLYLGQIQEDGPLVLTATKPAAGQPERITLRTVARGDRLVTLYERRSTIGEGFTRLAEVGYTRQGSQFGKGATFPECVVTGGFGSMTVTHEGKSYYVCCTGCRDIFQMDPAGVLAEYRARKKKEAEKAAEQDAPRDKSP